MTVDANLIIDVLCNDECVCMYRDAGYRGHTHASVADTVIDVMIGQVCLFITCSATQL